MRGDSVTLKTEVQFYVESCYTCGVLFGIPIDLQRSYREHGKSTTFYCPNGHGQCYTKSISSQLEEERRRRQAAEDTATRLRQQNDQLLTEVSRTNKELKAVRRRAVAGVCQFCHRTFQQVQRHIAKKHPTEVP